jgi:cytochrome c peroxidase
LGVPRNAAVPFFYENGSDIYGLVVNRDGAAYVDRGVGAFLDVTPSVSARPNPDTTWIKLAPAFNGAFQVPTLRNVDMRPTPDFVKAYMHNGYFKSLKEVVHFYNTRDVLPRCRANDPREKVSCWPPPEHPNNLNKKELGNLGLTAIEEDAVVAFLRTLTDGYAPP